MNNEIIISINKDNLNNLLSKINYKKDYNLTITKDKLIFIFSYVSTKIKTSENNIISKYEIEIELIKNYEKDIILYIGDQNQEILNQKNFFETLKKAVININSKYIILKIYLDKEKEIEYLESISGYNSETHIKKTKIINNYIEIYGNDPKEKFKYTFITQEYKRYNYNKLENTNSFEINGNIFNNVIPQLQKTSSTEKEKMFLKSVFFEHKNNEFNLISTDGKRLTKYRLNKNDYDKNEKDIGIIIPNSILDTICKNKITSSVSFFYDKNDNLEVQFESNDNTICFQTKYLNTSYPNYRQVIPHNASIKFSVSAYELKTYLDKIKVKDAKFEINNTKKTLEIYTSDDKHFENRNSFKIHNISIPPKIESYFFKLGIPYILDILKLVNIKEKNILINFELTEYINYNYSNNPILCYFSELSQYLFLIMPIKLDSYEIQTIKSIDKKEIEENIDDQSNIDDLNKPEIQPEENIEIDQKANYDYLDKYLTESEKESDLNINHTIKNIIKNCCYNEYGVFNLILNQLEFKYLQENKKYFEDNYYILIDLKNVQGLENKYIKCYMINLWIYDQIKKLLLEEKKEYKIIFNQIAIKYICQNEKEIGEYFNIKFCPYDIKENDDSYSIKFFKNTIKNIDLNTIEIQPDKNIEIEQKSENIDEFEHVKTQNESFEKQMKNFEENPNNYIASTKLIKVFKTIQEKFNEQSNFKNKIIKTIPFNTDYRKNGYFTGISLRFYFQKKTCLSEVTYLSKELKKYELENIINWRAIDQLKEYAITIYINDKSYLELLEYNRPLDIPLNEVNKQIKDKINKKCYNMNNYFELILNLSELTYLQENKRLLENKYNISIDLNEIKGKEIFFIKCYYVEIKTDDLNTPEISTEQNIEIEQKNENIDEFERIETQNIKSIESIDIDNEDYTNLENISFDVLMSKVSEVITNIDKQTLKNQIIIRESETTTKIKEIIINPI